MSNQKYRFIWIVVLVCLFNLYSNTALAADSKVDQTTRIQVEATGYALLEADLGSVREAALKNAFRNALENAFGARITSATTMEGLTITSDVVVSQAWGHILSYTITKEWESKGSYYIEITAEVSSDARFWAEYEDSLNANRLHIKDLAMKQSYNLDEQVLPGGIYQDKILVIPVKGETFALKGVHTESLHIVWEQNLPSRLATPLVTDGEWIVAITNRQITVYNLLYGWIKWSYDIPEAVTQTPIIYQGNLYVTTQRGNLYMLGLKKGDLVWKYNSQSYFVSAPTIADDRLYFTDSQGYLHALDISRKSKAFKQLINPKLYATAPRPTSILTYLSWNDGNDIITAIDSQDGSTVWSTQGEVDKATTVLPPYLIHNRIIAVFIHNNHSRIYLLDAKTGHQYWAKDMDETIIEVSGVGEDLIIFNTWQGIRIIDAEYGNLLWESGAQGLKNFLITGEDRLYYMYEHNVDIYW